MLWTFRQGNRARSAAHWVQAAVLNKHHRIDAKRFVKLPDAYENNLVCMGTFCIEHEATMKNRPVATPVATPLQWPVQRARNRAGSCDELGQQ